jgi:phage-related protein
MKDVAFLGDSLQTLKGFPKDAMREAGYQMHGLTPADWKPVRNVGAGVREIRVWESSGTYRVIYVAKFEEAVYILHAFKKTTEQTRKTDINLVKERYSELMRARQ